MYFFILFSFCISIALYNIEISFQSSKMRFLFLIVSIGLFACQNNGKPIVKNSDTIKLKPRYTEAKTSDSMVITGAAQMLEYLPLLKGKTIALVVNQTSVINKTHLVDSLLSLGIKIKTIFADRAAF